MSAQEMKNFEAQLALLSFAEQLSLMESLAKLMQRTQNTQKQPPACASKKTPVRERKG